MDTPSHGSANNLQRNGRTSNHYVNNNVISDKNNDCSTDSNRNKTRKVKPNASEGVLNSAGGGGDNVCSRVVGNNVSADGELRTNGGGENGNSANDDGDREIEELAKTKMSECGYGGGGGEA